MALKKALGRGLGSIINSGIVKAAAQPAKGAPQAKAQISVGVSSYGVFREVPIELVVPSKYQARREFSESEIQSLADSIASEGLIQPLIVRKSGENYELIAGERRLRACRKLGLKKVAVCVQSASDASSAAKGLIENLQRTDLNPIDAALGIASLMQNFHLTQDAVAQRLGKPRSSIANSLRLLSLPDEVRGFVASGLISAGHAKILTGIEDPAKVLILARTIIEKGLSVRATEEAARKVKEGAPRRSIEALQAGKASAAKEAVIRDIQNKVASKLHASVTLKQSGKRGKIVIEYIDNDDLSRILEILGVRV